jgi:hypothetical protein
MRRAIRMHLPMLCLSPMTTLPQDNCSRRRPRCRWRRSPQGAGALLRAGVGATRSPISGAAVLAAQLVSWRRRRRVEEEHGDEPIGEHDVAGCTPVRCLPLTPKSRQVQMRGFQLASRRDGQLMVACGDVRGLPQSPQTTRGAVHARMCPCGWWGRGAGSRNSPRLQPYCLVIIRRGSFGGEIT